MKLKYLTKLMEFGVIKITKSGFGNKDGQIPFYLQEPLMIFDYFEENDAQIAKTKTKYLIKQEKIIKNKKTNASFRCPRKGFVPFDILGRLTISAKNDGIPNPGPNIILNESGELLKSPLYLVLMMNHGLIAAMALLYTQKDGSLKLEYLCAAPMFKGSGKALMSYMKSGSAFPKEIKNIYLNDDSKIPGYYLKQGFKLYGKTSPGTYYMNDPLQRRNKNGRILQVNKILDVYKFSLPKHVSNNKDVATNGVAKNGVAKNCVTKKTDRKRITRTRQKQLSEGRVLRRRT